MKYDENGQNDYEREEGERRYHERYKTRLNYRDQFYPPAWHEQEVTDEFYPEDEEHPETVEVCDMCGEPSGIVGLINVDGSDLCNICIKQEDL